jgi:hypothetical protein
MHVRVGSSGSGWQVALLREGTRISSRSPQCLAGGMCDRQITPQSTVAAHKGLIRLLRISTRRLCTRKIVRSLFSALSSPGSTLEVKWR